MQEKNLIKYLRKHSLTISVAESCTGGYLSYLLTKTAGSSLVFKGGLVVYSLYSKNKFFNLPLSYLKKTQGVSEEIAKKLANQIRKKFSSHIGVGVVGFSKPAPLPEKEGLLYYAISYKNKLLNKKINLTGRRNTIRKTAAKLIIEDIYKFMASHLKVRATCPPFAKALKDLSSSPRRIKG